MYNHNKLEIVSIMYLKFIPLRMTVVKFISNYIRTYVRMEYNNKQ
jgi:hypothetical protein